MKYNPALHLEELVKKIDKLHVEIYELESEGISAHIQKIKLHNLNEQFDSEFEKVRLEYLELFKDYYFTTEDIQKMLDLDIQMVTKRIAKEVDHIEFSKCIRRYIKGCRIKKSYDSLEVLLREKNVNIDKKIFFSRSSLIKWLLNHVFTHDKTPITSYLASKMVEDRNTASVLSTVNYMKENHLKYDMQLKRKNRQRLFFYMDYDQKRVLSRIPVNPTWDVEIIRLRESIE